MPSITFIKPRNIDVTGDFTVNSISATGNLSAANVKTNNLLYANGAPYALSSNAGGSNTQIQFNDGNSFAGNANLTFDKTTGKLTAAFVAGDGSNLANIAGANVTGQVGNATVSGTVYTNSQPNITSVGTLTSLTVNGNVNLGNIANIRIAGGTNAQLLSTDGNGNLSFVNQVSLTGYATETYVSNTIANLVNSAPALLDTLGEIANAIGNDANFTTTITNSLSNKLNTSDFSNTANSWGANYLPNYSGNISANFFIGNGSQLTGLPAGYTDSNVASYLPNYTGNLSGNVANVTTLNVSATSNLGNIANVKILGGTANYFLKTDGTGNLSFATFPLSSVTVDTFTANGNSNSFTLTTTPSSIDDLFVNINGVFQYKSSYSLAGATITLGSNPSNNSTVEVRTINNGAVLGGGSALIWNIANSNITMTSNNGYFVDTTNGAKSLTLPVSATLGDTIRINDLAGTFNSNACTILRNGHKIQGVADDIIASTKNASFGLVYSNSTYGWKLLEVV
jgi:hypothetical protein